MSYTTTILKLFLIIYITKIRQGIIIIVIDIIV